MKQRCENQQIVEDDKVYGAEAVNDQRAELANEILNCKFYSWTVDTYMTQKFMDSEFNGLKV